MAMCIVEISKFLIFYKCFQVSLEVMCFMQKNNFRVKFPLNSECLNARMVNFECHSTSQFHGCYLHRKHRQNRVFTTFTDFFLLLCLSESLSLSAPLAALSIRVAITVSSLTAFSTTRVSINSDIRILTFRQSDIGQTLTVRRSYILMQK